MNIPVLYSSVEGQALNPNGVVKTTALLYFQEELFGQRYENCKEILEIAKALGVEQHDLDAAIKFHLRAIQTQRPYEANQTKNRLRNLEEEK